MGAFIPGPGQPSPMKDGEFVANSLPNVVTFGFGSVAPPSPLYIQRDDQLVIEVVDFSGPHTVSVQGRLLLAPLPLGGQPSDAVPARAPQLINAQGIIEPFAVSISTLAGGPVSTLRTIPLAEGYLLSLAAVEISQSTVQRGLVFVRAWINRGATTALSSNAFNVLLADYVTATAMVGWPYGRVLHPTEGPGRIFNAVVSAPGAGTDWVMQVPAGLRRRVQSVNAQLATSATVANRIVRVQIVGQTGAVVYQGAPSAVIVASTTAQVSMQSGQASEVTDPQTVSIALPTPCMLQGAEGTRDILRVSTTNLQAGDQWSGISLEVEDWIDNGLL